jgi:hypothetical protein
MIYGFLFSVHLSLLLFLVAFISVHFVPSHLSAWSDPLLLLELWDARLDTPFYLQN